MTTTSTTHGPVEQATRQSLAELPNADPALAAVAIALATLLDAEPTAAAARELRQTLGVIREAHNAEARRGSLDALVEDIRSRTSQRAGG